MHHFLRTIFFFSLFSLLTLFVISCHKPKLDDGEGLKITVLAEQTPGTDGFDAGAVIDESNATADLSELHAACGAIKLNFQLSGITKIEFECVDGFSLTGTTTLQKNSQGKLVAEDVENSAYIITFNAPAGGLVPGKDYIIYTLPCDVYGGYRISIFREGRVAHYFGVHQTMDAGTVISPLDLIESELEFVDPAEPLVEEERPGLDATTSSLLQIYKANPTEANKQALMEQMGIRYDKVVARKKSKLRQLEREALTPNLIEEMQEIVDEMVQNREERLRQQFLRLIDSRTDDDPNDAWMVLRGAPAQNAYIAYTPLTNAEYAEYKTDFTYAPGKGNYPVVNISIPEARAYCEWLSSQDAAHNYRLPSDEEWVLAAGHMPKDVVINAGHVTSGLTSVTAYSQTKGACGGIDFWGNCWEWTSTTDASGLYIIKGGSWDSPRDDCRSEKVDVVRDGTQGYANVGIRVVRIDPR